MAVVEMVEANGIEFAKDLVIAFLIFYVGKLVIGFVVRGLRKVMRARDVDPTLETFLGNLVRMVLMVIVIIAAIGQLGIQTTSFIAIFGAAGLAVGLADSFSAMLSTGGSCA